ncbi:hypothetical protein ES703_19956 [subsurface metagenome]
MKADNLNEKTILIKELLNSGINVTPSILDFLTSLDDPLKILKLIIKNVSFLPSFNSHLTLEVLQQISNKELHDALKKVLLKEVISQPFKFIAVAILSNFGALRRIPSFKTKQAPPRILLVSILGKSLNAETSSSSVESPFISTGNRLTA